MGSIINRATKIISKKGLLMAKRFFDVGPNSYLFIEGSPFPSFDFPSNFIASLGTKGKYALFVLVVLLFSQLKAQNINTPNKNGPLGTQVNTFSGNLFVPRNDIHVPARGLDINISFAYNTFNYNQNKGYGNGWSFTYGMSYRADVAGNITVVQGDNREDGYTLNTGGTYTPLPGFFDQLTQYQSGKFLLQGKYGVKYYFDNSTTKRLTKILDPNSNVLTFSYSDTLLTSITNTAGQTITLNYSGGRLSSVVDAIASPTRTYTYTYDGYGNLIQVLDPLGNKTVYTYLVNGPMSGITDKNGNSADIIYYPNYTVSELISCNSRKSFSYDSTAKITVVTDYLPTSTNQITTYSYTTFASQGLQRVWLTHVTGNCCGYNLAFAYDNLGNLLSIINGNGSVYGYTYDNNGNILTITDPLGNKSTYTYNSTYNEVTNYTDENGNVYAINYDNAGNPTQVAGPDNITESATYSALGDLLTGTDGNGNVYHFAYNTYGYPTQLAQPLSSIINLTYDARGNILTEADPNGNTNTLRYDALSRPTSIIDPLNHTASLTYDGNGNTTAFTDANGHTSHYGYDASNRLVTATDAAGSTRQYTYDAMNNLIQYKDQLGKTTTYGYDNLNRLSTIADALGNGYGLSYDYNDNVTSITLPTGAALNYVYDKMNRPISGSDNIGLLGTVTYDKNGNISSFTNGTGSTISFTYDSHNRMIKLIDPLGNSRSFVYDKNDNITSSTDRNNHTTSYTNDALNRQTAITDNNGNTTKTSYDAAGNVISVTDQKNNVTTYAYDALQRRTGITYPNASGIHYTYDNTTNILTKQLTDGSTITYQYDALDRMTTKSYPGNNYSYTYDAKSRMTGATNVAGTVSLTYDDIDRITSENFNAHTTAYTYNTAARTKNILYPDGSSVTWNYDIRKRLASIARGTTSLATYQYTNANMLQQLNYGNGTIANWQYDQANRMTNLSTQASSLPNLALTYDNESNKTALIRPNQPQFSEQYSYDAGYRLLGFTQGSTPNTYAYDAVGNRATANLNGTSNTYTTNNMNQYTSLSNGSTTNFAYDGNGNLTNDGVFGKRYDVLGRLLVDSNASNRIVYQYDALGRRVQKTVNGSAINYYYAGLTQLEQRNATSDALLNETIYSSNLTPILLGVNNNSYYYHQNDLNSVEAITNANGTLVESYKYDVYGKPQMYDSLGNAITASNIGNRFAFTGQEYDAETRNYQFHYRNYSPTTGNFNQRDPIGYGDAMGMYQYVRNNPSNLIDPLGLSPCPPQMQPPPPNPQDWYWYFEWTVDGLGTAQSAPGVASLVKTSLANKALFSNSTAFNGVGSGLNFLSAVSSANDYANYTDQGNSNDIYNKADLLSSSVISTTGIVPNPVASVYGVLNSANKAAFGKPLAQDFEPVANFAGDVYGQEFYDKPDFNAAYGYILRTQGYDRAEQFAKIRQRIDQQGERQSPPHDPNFTPCPPNKNNNGNQNPTPPGPQNPGTPIVTNNINSQDPNEIIGPTGVGTPQFVSAVDQMPYTINFENSINASAPAKTVRVNYPIDAKQDISNISLGSFGFNSLTYNVPPNTPAFYQRLDARDSLGLYVDVTAGLDVANRQIFWVFQSIDPITLLTPSDPLKGFLLLNDTSKPTSGHGFVNFYTKPVGNAVTGDTVHAAATIVFDGNDTIPTNVAKNTIDAVAPTSHMNGLPSNSTSTKVPLSWTAVDDAKGSGVKSYSLYIAVNGGAFGLYATNISRKDTTFTGASGNSYSFFVLGTDSVGNTETLKPGAEATTYINAVILPVTWLYFNAVKSDKDGLLTWATATETNTKSFEIERSIDGRNFSAIGTVAAAGNSTVQSNYAYTDKNVVSLNVSVVYYRLKQIDKDGTATYSNIVALQLPVINVGPIVQAYPNPFKETLNVMIANMTALDLSDNIAIYTLEGKIVYEKPIGQRMLNTTITLTDLPQLTPGMYILKLGLNKQSYSFKLMKQ